MAKIVDVQEVSLDQLKPYEANAKIHGADQVKKLMASIEEFGFLTPCLIDADYNIIAGHGRVMAAKKLEMETVPCVFIEGLTDEQRRAYILADNRLGELAEWDDELVQRELQRLESEGFEIEVTGFEIEVDEEEGLDEIEADFNPTLTLPESNIYIYSVSAFGTNSEKIVMIKIPQNVADGFLKAVEERPVPEIVEKLVEGLRNV